MSDPVPLVEVWRGPVLESRHRGHAVVCDATGAVRAAWGDPALVMLPRSSCKMLQALPLVEDGGDGVTDARIALACASHTAAAIHVEPVRRWLAELGLGAADLRCGPQAPRDEAEAERLRGAGGTADQVHNNCSGKHTGFLALGTRLGAGPEYVEPDHPVQVRVRAAFEEMTGETSPGHAIDGCSAPNFATTLRGLATAVARMGDPRGRGATRAAAARRIVGAMMAHPRLIAGEGRPCAELTTALAGRGTVKCGAEAVYTAILPEAGLGVAIKVEDGGLRGSETAVTALLVRLGVLDAAHPVTARWLAPRVLTRRGAEVGGLRPDPEFYAGGRPL